MTSNHFNFFQNKECEYFPCHEGADRETFNCMFCYCPLYMLRDKCGGDFVYLKDGTKDCSGCLKAHDKEFADIVLSKWEEIRAGAALVQYLRPEEQCTTQKKISGLEEEK